MILKSWKTKYKILTRLLFLSIICALILPGLCIQSGAYNEQVLTLKEAEKLALSNSEDYKKTQTKISLQKARYADAVKSAALKKKNMETFRWSPLLSFKLPEKPDLSDAYDWQYKPIQMQCELTNLNHELTDLKYQTTEQISNLYVQAYVSQEKLAFSQKQKEEVQKTLDRKRILLKTGEAAQKEVDKLEQTLKKMDSDISLRKRELSSVKSKLSQMLKLDVTTGYRFENPMIAAKISRSALSALTAYTLDNDQGYYEAKMNTRLGLISLQLNAQLMKQQYGSKMNIIQPYINQAENGQEVDADAFKQAYDSFLNNIDKPWTGKLKILFIKIPKEWYKGSLDGVRYVEDDPYALYTAALKYEDLKNEEESVCTSLKSKVSDSFEAIITASNAYDTLEQEVKQQGRSLEKAVLFSRLGEKKEEELKSQQDSFEEQKMDALDSAASLTELIHSFDRLTCGGITKYLEGQLSGGETDETDKAALSEEYKGEPSYYIGSKVEDNLFIFGIVIPDGLGLSVSSFELWVNGTQIGERTAAGSEIRHLKLTLSGIDKAEVRLYDGDTFIGKCDIDPMVNSGELKVEEK